MNLYFIEIYSESLRVMLNIIVFKYSKLSSISKSNLIRSERQRFRCGRSIWISMWDIVLLQRMRLYRRWNRWVSGQNNDPDSTSVQVPLPYMDSCIAKLKVWVMIHQNLQFYESVKFLGNNFSDIGDVIRSVAV